MQTNKNLLGLHILLSLQTNNTEKLKDLESFMQFINKTLIHNSLINVGNSSYVFENASFTAAICLMESHICIHTWPEINTVTVDVYLCNYSQDNTLKVKSIATKLVEYFEAKIVKQIEVER
jgi:S-adenosylmethionine decarboxylase